MAGKGIVQKYNSTKEVEGRERIFGDKKPERGSWVIDKETGKLVERGAASQSHAAAGPYIQNNIEPFKSPITGELITCRKQLREHHKQHGTTDLRDYSPEHFRKKGQENVKAFHGDTPADKADRIERIKRAIDKQGR